MNSRASPPAEDPRQRLLQLADACVLCGLCLPHCPTYRLDATEAESPRGRIMLARALAEGTAAADISTALALDHCLSCGRCEQVCPAKVRFGELMLLTRSLQPPRPRTAAQHALMWASHHPDLFALLLRIARPLNRLAPARWRNLLKRAGKPISADAAQLPAAARVDGSALDAPAARRQPLQSLKIGLLTGCVARSLDVPAQRAARRVLSACGHRVEAPAEQVCCGALALHAGDALSAKRQAERNRGVWSAIAPDVLLGTASGCQTAFAASLRTVVPVLDVFEFLAADSAFLALPLRPLRQRVLLHLPCTQRDNPAALAGLMSVLSRIPGLELEPLPDTGCCGAAGAYMLQFPARAEAIRAPLVDAILTSRRATLLTSNIGCAAHLQAAVELAGLVVRHPLELLAEALP